MIMNDPQVNVHDITLVEAGFSKGKSKLYNQHTFRRKHIQMYSSNCRE